MTARARSRHGRSTRSRHVLVPFGTRPEVVKLAPVVAALQAAGHRVSVVDTGQHTDPALSSQLQTALGLTPDSRFCLPAAPAERTGALHADAARAVAGCAPDLVLALGDTTTVPAYALAARAAGVPFAHLEAGLRSLNPRSVEEVNRRVAAAAAQLHLAPTERAAAFLAAEGVDAERVFVVGNPVVDTLVARGVRRVPLAERRGVLVTAHRPTNVDDPVRLARLVGVVRALAEQVGPVTFPVHPRTAARLAAAGLTGALEHPGVTLTGPVGYDALLAALASARLAVTDSGGIQEEAAYLGVPVVVLRGSTPRWEGVEAGTTTLAGLADDRAAAAVLAAAAGHTSAEGQERAAAAPCPYGDGTTGPQVAAVLADPRTDALLALDEPDFTDGRLPW
ncbi:UDP-N-acetylglucosamine 2-epimerase (non-hydrolyzing) [Geodermatophilus sp. TF02-6]|uniref:non-hydrolyzing UDP-N-acetylglucosamine 2-epimerase n=1 Tax=Geodermatophilus sp. TF02-6 TaxID=2250575 RepID=UPI000DEB56C8|nr:UDP-N-acetylglucosamine 2-epimerase (non-hydrolyzing) [Geodermatophilus sp. TF02-6]RBY78129.1 UDP-N-acetylglucosamine 2-epimerase (non-hydrolyzing) [Geodermatophilus sp. TF02-6]